ncbi:MAG TPA: biphenyl 2,3-dioxygenase [Gammaproteobacteria bacterium]|nr:proteorhodopsin [uncultured bacterium]RPG01022.1 MAG: biphenyl 2,3-dioxygenase [Proteobacteria bacterium TMED51]HAU42648.1 biphenyl 2,3-dioxygenase [Gammaproteobacteria bacterium]HBP84765.1 biphenyl 2,3-dioxygenase [Gammaproteobacteria bacterium]
MLQPTDLVGVTFWLISIAMVAATVFFFLERDRVVGKWKTSVTVAGLVTLIAAVHYFYMREIWVVLGESPTVYRYIDWLLTVPLQIIEFFLILAAIAVVPTSLFWKLLVASVVMLVGGYMGEAGFINVTVGFIIGMIGWLYIIYEIFAGEASKINASSGNVNSQMAFKTIRLIVTIGWAIYPIGYVMGYMTQSASIDSLNIIYNLADLVNKIAFGVAIWLAATRDSARIEAEKASS